MPSAALLFIGHDSLKGSMNNFRENQVSVLWLPLRSWNKRLFIYLFYKFWLKAFPLALFSNSTMNFISFAVPSMESFNASSLPRVLAELLFAFILTILTTWKWIVKLVKTTGSLAHAMNHLAPSVFISFVFKLFFSLPLLTNCCATHTSLKWNKQEHYSFVTSQHQIRIINTVKCMVYKEI